MMVEHSLADSAHVRTRLVRAGSFWRRIMAAAVLAVFALSVGFAAPAAAAKPPNAPLNSTDSMLQMDQRLSRQART